MQSSNEEKNSKNNDSRIRTNNYQTSLFYLLINNLIDEGCIAKLKISAKESKKGLKRADLIELVCNGKELEIPKIIAHGSRSRYNDEIIKCLMYYNEFCGFEINFTKKNSKSKVDFSSFENYKIGKFKDRKRTKLRVANIKHNNNIMEIGENIVGNKNIDALMQFGEDFSTKLKLALSGQRVENNGKVFKKFSDKTVIVSNICLENSNGSSVCDESVQIPCSQPNNYMMIDYLNGNNYMVNGCYLNYQYNQMSQFNQMNQYNFNDQNNLNYQYGMNVDYGQFTLNDLFSNQNSVANSHEQESTYQLIFVHNH